MADYGFYTDQYMGSLIPERAFPEAIARAVDALNRFRRIYRIGQAGTVEENMALCAMAEAVYTASKRAGIASASMGSTTVHYTGHSGLERRLLQKAAIYLDISRGVG